MNFCRRRSVSISDKTLMRLSVNRAGQPPTHRNEVRRQTPLGPPLSLDVVRQGLLRHRHAPVALLVHLSILPATRLLRCERRNVHVLFQVEVEELEHEREGFVDMNDIEKPVAMARADEREQRSRRRHRKSASKYQPSQTRPFRVLRPPPPRPADPSLSSTRAVITRDSLDDALGALVRALPELHQDADLAQRRARHALVLLLEPDLFQRDDRAGVDLRVPRKGMRRADRAERMRGGVYAGSRRVAQGRTSREAGSRISGGGGRRTETASVCALGEEGGRGTCLSAAVDAAVCSCARRRGSARDSSRRLGRARRTFSDLFETLIVLHSRMGEARGGRRARRARVTGERVRVAQARGLGWGLQCRTVERVWVWTALHSGRKSESGRGVTVRGRGMLSRWVCSLGSRSFAVQSRSSCRNAPRPRPAPRHPALRRPHVALLPPRRRASVPRQLAPHAGPRPRTRPCAHRHGRVRRDGHRRPRRRRPAHGREGVEEGVGNRLRQRGRVKACGRQSRRQGSVQGHTTSRRSLQGITDNHHLLVAPTPSSSRQENATLTRTFTLPKQPLLPSPSSQYASSAASPPAPDPSPSPRTRHTARPPRPPS